MERSKLLLISTILLFFVLFYLTFFQGEEHYMLLSFLMLIVAMFPIFIRFEKKKLDARSIVLLAILAAIAAVSRVPFAALPSVQPTTFVVIMSAIVFGAESGFIIGAIAALVSNLFLGQGPWTPWQMFAWGMIGLTAGLFKNWLFVNNKIPLLLFGFISGFLFGWTMNLWYLVGFMGNISFEIILMSIASSFYFDLAHGLSNVFFLYIFSTKWKKTFERFKVKYGLMSEI
ncbi:ECF transporter S component [Calidifontibacillus oryziterrae]|uniref:ECF transporter S component n=1 Tax=Calidifontibacillus oryziterrae TaxID=1191699 RepID=UPI0002DEF455|nr:ECF transporter S component [Calidifontibacillus oryziterrae]